MKPGPPLPRAAEVLIIVYVTATANPHPGEIGRIAPAGGYSYDCSADYVGESSAKIVDCRFRHVLCSRQVRFDAALACLSNEETARQIERDAPATVGVDRRATQPASQ